MKKALTASTWVPTRAANMAAFSNVRMNRFLDLMTDSDAGHSLSMLSMNALSMLQVRRLRYRLHVPMREGHRV
jgi:hypothetical protein